MVSPKKLMANRLNGAQSSGPRTAVGKTISSRNAVKHGIFSRLPILPALGETHADWATHREAVIAALNPADKLELDLAERYAHLSWRAGRAAKYEAAAAAVALQPAAALLATPAPDPDDPLARLRADPRTAPERGAASHMQRAAAAAPIAIELLDRLADATADEPVDNEIAQLVWRAASAAAGIQPGLETRQLIRRFWTGPGGTRTGSTIGWEYSGWTVKTVRLALAFLAAEGRLDAEQHSQLTAKELLESAAFFQAKARANAEEVGRAVGALQAEAVESAMKRVVRGPAELELAIRYEKHISNEMESVLRQLAMLKELRLAKFR